VREIAEAARRIQARADSWASAAAAAREEVALEKQQQLVAAAARMGLSVMLVAAGWASLRYGRVWEVHAVCSAAAGARRGVGRLMPAPARGVASMWSYSLCCVESMGERAAGVAGCHCGQGLAPPLNPPRPCGDPGRPYTPT
jgi:hypothetical protein